MDHDLNSSLKVLLIAPYPVLPASSGGKIRIVELARQLSRLGFQVWILAPYKPDQRRHYDRSYGFELVEVRYPFVVPALLTDRPFPYGYLVSFHPGYALTLKRFLQGFDIFQFEHPFFGDLTRFLPPDRPILYDAHNVEYDYERSECRQTLTRKIVGKRIQRIEGQLAHRASRVLVCSNSEGERFARLYGVPADKLLLAPNGIKHIVDAPPTGAPTELFERFPGLSRFQRYAIYSGSDVEHNRQAVRLILERFAPQLRQECAFIIHGTVARAFPKTRDSNVFSDVSFGGLEPYAMPGAVGLNPVTQGGGTNLKLIQYMAHGLPVISTEFGVRGYDELRPYISVRSIEGFVEALRSPITLDPRSSLLLQRYLWEVIAGDLAETYLALADRDKEKGLPESGRPA